jgi:DNA-binding CsgD family transcriptional regulator
VGRRDELAYLRTRRLEAGSSRGGMVLIAGDAGVGKTRLIAEFCGSLVSARWRVASGSCSEFGGRPYGPVLDALARFDPQAAELAPAASKQEQFDAIVERLATIASRRALVVTIEDLHWADAATLDLLAHLGSSLHRIRALVLVSFRPDDLHPDNPTTASIAKIARNARAGRIDLAPLAGVELRTFIDEALAGIALPDEMRRAVALAGEGNPFFTEELLKSAVERNAMQADDRRGGALPPSVRATLLERLRPFDPEERRIVAQAAVIGRTFNVDLLATMLDAEPGRLLPTLRRARDFQLVEELSPMLFRFRHGLTREAIYSDFLGAELRPLHRTIAVALETAPDHERAIEALAYHWWAAGDSARSAHYNELAGDAAANVHAHEDAIAFYERALGADCLDLIGRGSILEKVAERRIALTWTAEAHATYCDAADVFRRAGASEREAGCRSQAAIIAYVIGIPEPTAPLEAMLDRLDAGEYLARSRIHLGLAWLAATFWFPTRAAHHLERVDSRALAAAPDIGLRFHNVSAWVAMTVADVDRFRSEHEAWVDAARASGSVRALVAAHANGAMCWSFFGFHEEALDNLDRALRIARESRNRYAEETCHAFASMCHLMRGDLEQARAAAEAVPATTEHHVNATFATAWGTIVAAYLGDRGMIEKWFGGFDVGSQKLETECGAGFAEIMVRRGRPGDAAALLHRVLPDCELIRGNVLTLLAVGRYGAPVDRARARDYLSRAAEGPAESIERPALALFDAIALRREERLDEAAVLARDAAVGFRRLRIPLLEAAAYEEAGDAKAAQALYRRCGATYDVRRLDDAAAADPHSLEVRETATPLSAREREIASLAARGHTNLEIARGLSISRKTVEKHLGSAFQKLGVSSRRELRSNVTVDR